MQQRPYNTSYQYDHTSQDYKIARHSIVSELTGLNPYFAYVSSFTDIYYNITKYSNQFFTQLYMEVKYLDLKFQENPECRKVYDELNIDISRALQKYQKEQEAAANQQQQYADQYQPQFYQQQYQQQHYQQQQYYPEQPTQQQQYYPQQQTNYTEYNQTYPNNAQTYPNSAQYPQQGGKQDRRQNNYPSNTYHEKSDNRNHRKKEFHEKGAHPRAQDNQYTREESLPEPVVEPEPVVVVPEPEPPKPEPKPTKFTITQIKGLINEYSKEERREELESLVNPEVVAKVKEISGWKMEEVEVKLKEDMNKFTKKDSRRDDNRNDNRNNDRNNNNNNNSNFTIKTGVRKDENKEMERLGYKRTEESKVQIVVGAKETIEARQMKVELKKKAFDFAKEKMEEDKGLDKTELDRKEIIYNLNLIVPENLKDIEKDLLPYLYEDEVSCRVIIEEVIKKAWDQPKYASTYAKLCYDFSKKSASEFKFEVGKKDNPFKYLLVDKVQHSFDEEMEPFPEFQNAEDKDLFLKSTKKKILSNVKFIAELIVCKILRKMIIKYCISRLFHSFLSHFTAYNQRKEIEDSIYDYHYEAVIEFIENIGEKFESIDEKEPSRGPSPYNQVDSHITDILTKNCPPNLEILKDLECLTREEYFKLFYSINDSFIKTNFPRLSALLQNLNERRENNWQKHLSAADGPKKLKEIQDDIDREEEGGKVQDKVNKEKQNQEKLNKKVKDLFEGWQGDKKSELRDMKEILRSHPEHPFYVSLLKQVADEKKVLVAKRIEFFTVLFEAERFSPKDFRKAWIDAIKYLAFGSEDFPFCGAALAKVLVIMLEKEGKLADFYEKFADEDEQYFMTEVMQKYHHYSQDEAALNYIKPKAKYSGLI